MSPLAATVVTTNSRVADDLCSSVSSVYPGATVEYRPNTSTVYLVVPADAIASPKQAARQYHSGGTAAVLNYDAFMLHNENQRVASENFLHLNTVAGLNVGDWLFRSGQSYSASGKYSQWTRQYAYAQKSFIGIKSTIQAGEINTSNSVFSGIPIYGVQLLPEEGLRYGGQQGHGRVEGIAYSAGRVEIHQNHTLVHTSIVPAGPFALTGLPLNSWQAVDVTVIENTGTVNSFTLPATGISSEVFNSTPGYSFAAGQYHRYNNESGVSPELLTGTATWPVSKNTKITSGLIMAQNYRGVGWSLGQSINSVLSLSLAQLSSLNDQGKSGTSINGSLTARVLPSLSLGLDSTQNTESYRSFQDGLYKHNEKIREPFPNYLEPQRQYYGFKERTRDQYGASLRWSNSIFGNFGISTSYATRFDARSTQYVNGSWSKNYGRARMEFNVRKSASSANEYYASDNGYTTYLSLTLPLGQATAFTRSHRNYTSSGVVYGDQVNDSFGYQAQVEHEYQNQRNQFSATTNFLPRYTSVGLGYSQSSSDDRAYNARLSGAVVGHSNGLTMSPYSVEDTFSIVSVGDMAGIKVSTPRGPVWTDPFGQAVAPGLAAFGESQLMISGENLPRNVDIVSNIKKTNSARGSVQHVEFDVSITRRIIMKVTDQMGFPLPEGLTVIDAKGNYVTTSLSNGKLYFPKLSPGQILYVQLPEGTNCSVQYNLPEVVDESRLFETLNANCITT